MTLSKLEQAELEEVYRLALYLDPQSIAPSDLDDDLAEFIYKLVLSQRPTQLTNTAKSRIWQNI